MLSIRTSVPVPVPSVLVADGYAAGAGTVVRWGATNG